MSMIVSSNRTRAQWAEYREAHTRTPLDRFITERPHQPAEVVVAEHAIVPERFHVLDHHNDQTPAVWWNAPTCENA